MTATGTVAAAGGWRGVAISRTDAGSEGTGSGLEVSSSGGGRRGRLSGRRDRGLELGLSAPAGRPELVRRPGLLARRHAAAKGPGGGVELGLVGTDPGRQGVAARVASRTRSR